MGYSEEQVKAMVRQALSRLLGPDGIGDNPSASDRAAGSPAPRPMVTEADVLAIPAGGTLRVAPGALITPLARDAALDRNIGLALEQAPASVSDASRSTAGSRVVALGADHGGLAMKEDLKVYLQELGYDVIDCGTHSTASVDYPDYAYAVAQTVSEGRAWRGIMVDGAGIGSCMAANKVPGIRAAMCYDHATAINSREHNNANVLTLGGALLGPSLARQIARTWLETAFSGDRHARRVDKIMGIEKRFLR